MTEKTIILGSASPRRRELLAQIGAEFEVRVSNKEEVYHSNIVQETFFPEISGADGSHVHEVQPLVLPAEFLPEFEVQ